MQLSIKFILLFFFSIVVFFLTRQVPFDNFSFLSNIALISLFSVYIFQKPSILGKQHLVIFIWLMLLIGYSFICQNQISNVIRFSIIFLSIILAYNIVMPIQVLKIVFFFVIIQAIFLILFEIILLLFFNIENYLPIRFFFLDKRWGDVYTYTGFYYLIQLKGNALLPFAYMLTFVWNFSSVKIKYFYRITFLLGVIIAGNFAFFISIFVFHVFKYMNMQGLSYRVALKRILTIVIIGVIFAPIVLNYTQDTLERKSDVSLGTRSDQLNVLISDLDENVVTLLFGQGLGHTLSVKTSFRDYTDNIYFELQSLYFMNQLGVINFLLFLVVNIILAIIFIKNKSLLWIYFCYIIYASTNPYLLDTTHVIVIILLVSINSYNNENRLRISPI